MKNPFLAIIVFAVLAVLLLLAGGALGSRPLTGAGALSLAAAAFATGLHQISSRYARDYGDARDTFMFAGVGGVLIGVETLALSGALAVGALAYWTHREDALLAFVRDRPGFALLTAGLIFVGGGGARVLGPLDWRGAFFERLPDRLVSVVLALLGLAFLSVGAFEIAAPEAFDDAVEEFLGPLGSRVGREH